MWRFKKKKIYSILTFLSLLCKFEENLWTKVALVTDGFSVRKAQPSGPLKQNLEDLLY